MEGRGERSRQCGEGESSLEREVELEGKNGGAGGGVEGWRSWMEGMAAQRSGGGDGGLRTVVSR